MLIVNCDLRSEHIPRPRAPRPTAADRQSDRRGTNLENTIIADKMASVGNDFYGYANNPTNDLINNPAGSTNNATNASLVNGVS